ncbi:MAG: MBL fold metallo-hydrolase [Clostridiales bacterium]|jgi:glyoxylase-like metal-dependent hydrolase (beta-lactamase superfamily II)|nr:MBL fold metallo-hydrolase [Clostridiales bacterium]
MKLIRIINGVLEENTYIVYDEKTLGGFLVDPGSDTERIAEAAQGIRLEAVLLTHGHFDHAMSAKAFQDKGIKIYIHAADADKLCGRHNLSRYAGYKFDGLTADVLLSGGETLDIAGFKVGVIHTPGHSRGGVCYFLRDYSILFSGDTLFFEDIGRSDFYDGDYELLVKSIREKLFVLDGNTVVYPGHDESTAIEHERGRV